MKPNKEQIVYWTIFGFISLALIGLMYFIYYLYRRRKQSVQAAIVPSDKKLSKEDEDVVRKFVKPMYKPQEVGHRTGRYQLFQTNKGIRRYEVNEHDWPLPENTDSQTRK